MVHRVEDPALSLLQLVLLLRHRFDSLAWELLHACGYGHKKEKTTTTTNHQAGLLCPPMGLAIGTIRLPAPLALI